MRKNPHRPIHHKAVAVLDTRRFKPRRAHGLTPREAPAPSVLERAAKRAPLYMHRVARFWHGVQTATA